MGHFCPPFRVLCTTPELSTVYQSFGGVNNNAAEEFLDPPVHGPWTSWDGGGDGLFHGGGRGGECWGLCGIPVSKNLEDLGVVCCECAAESAAFGVHQHKIQTATFNANSMDDVEQAWAMG